MLGNTQKSGIDNSYIHGQIQFWVYLASTSYRNTSYLDYMTLQDSRIWIRIRARSIKWVKYNNKSSFKDSLNCRFCTEDIHEIQDHLQECRGTWYVRRNLSLEDPNNWKAVLLFWRRMTVKIAAVASDGTLTRGTGSDRNVLPTQS